MLYWLAIGRRNKDNFELSPVEIVPDNDLMSIASKGRTGFRYKECRVRLKLKKWTLCTDSNTGKGYKP